VTDILKDLRKAGSGAEETTARSFEGTQAVGLFGHKQMQQRVAVVATSCPAKPKLENHGTMESIDRNQTKSLETQIQLESQSACYGNKCEYNAANALHNWSP